MRTLCRLWMGGRIGIAAPAVARMPSGSSGGVLRSVPELIAAIQEYLAAHDGNPEPFLWTAKAQDILRKVIRANGRLGSENNEALH